MFPVKIFCFHPAQIEPELALPEKSFVTKTISDDCLIIGGGVVGLSLAYVLAERGQRVRVLDAGLAGREASWAGAGILPPANAHSDNSLTQLTALSNDLHAAWAEQLREEIGIDNGFRRCGGIYLAREPGDRDELERQVGDWRRGQLEFTAVIADELSTLEPALAPSPPITAAYLAPQECQLRNPRHLQALLAALRRRNVSIEEGQAVVDFKISHGRIQAAITSQAQYSANSVCLTAGCWTGDLAERLGVRLAIKPVRGQMLLFSSPKPILSRVINEGKRYLVPREDGKLLVGSTEEDAGFDRANTPESVDGLMQFLASLVSFRSTIVGNLKPERAWAGLRPATADGFPYLGRLPDLENAFINAGHFRSGLQLSPGSAEVVARLMTGEDPGIALSPFDPAR